jgi:hypothetical protein
MENNTDILDRITPEEIEEWMLAARARHGLESVSTTALYYTHRDAGCYWSLISGNDVGQEETFTESLSKLREKQLAACKAEIGKESA